MKPTEMKNIFWMRRPIRVTLLSRQSHWNEGSQKLIKSTETFIIANVSIHSICNSKKKKICWLVFPFYWTVNCVVRPMAITFNHNHLGRNIVGIDFISFDNEIAAGSRSWWISNTIHSWDSDHVVAAAFHADESNSNGFFQPLFGTVRPCCLGILQSLLSDCRFRTYNAIIWDSCPVPPIPSPSTPSAPSTPPPPPHSYGAEC